MKAGNTVSSVAKVMILPFLFFSILSLQSFAFAETVNTKMREGISQYHEGEFKEAAENFSFAHTDRPEDSRISYNLGNAHYRDGKFQEALQAYNQSALDEKNPDIRKKSLYNTGNTMVKLGKLEEAESAYKKVLELDPGDMDAKYNLEYVRQQLESKKEEQDSGKDKQEGEDNPSDNEKGDDQNQKSEGDQQSENQPPPPDNSDSENNGQEEPSQTGENIAEEEISKEKAEQMLEGLSEDLKNISRMQAGKTKTNYQGNDW